MGVYGVVGDVHGNLRALEAVLTELQRANVRDVVCVGDLIGYCAAPNACVALARAERFECISGNHELIALGRLGFDRCGLAPAHALARTRQTLDDASRSFLAGLPPSAARGASLFVHGSLANAWEYMSSAHIIAENARALAKEVRVCFFGHTHVARAYGLGEGRVVEEPARGTLRLARSPRWFINPGSVDGSRARERVARFAVVHDGDAVEFRSARYDHAACEREARRDGYRLPRRTLAWHAIADGLGRAGGLWQ